MSDKPTGLKHVGTHALRQRIGPTDEKALTVKKLFRILVRAVADGHGDAVVCFDAEARTFNAHYIEIDRADIEDPLGDGQHILILTTRYH